MPFLQSNARQESVELQGLVHGPAPVARRSPAHESELQDYLDRNESYVFFTPIEGNPRGSLNVEVSGERSLATDKTLFPRGAVCFVDTRVGSGSGKSFRQFMFDQDTGGAIRTAGRADIYLGSGATAERLAGTTEQQGQLYYLFLKDGVGGDGLAARE